MSFDDDASFGCGTLLIFLLIVICFRPVRRDVDPHI